MNIVYQQPIQSVVEDTIFTYYQFIKANNFLFKN